MLQGRGLITLLIVMLILSAGSASAELYKWTDPTGRHFYSDVPPPGGKAEVMAVKTSVDPASQKESTNTSANTEPEANNAKAKKVVMYSATWCGVCKKAKAYFDAEGIRYTEYDIENTRKGRSDYKRLKGTGVPIIMVGDKRMNGFSKGKFEKIYES